MYKSEYPEWGRREAMLWAIHEWVQDRPAGKTMLSFVEVATLVGGGEYVAPDDEDPDKQAAKKRQAEQLHLFCTLVREGLIDADLGNPINGPVPFTRVKVRGLSRWGLQLIQELPDPNRSLLNRLDDMALAIRGLQDVPDEEKDNAEKALEEIKDFARKFGPAAAVQILAALLKGG
jgi:hypothetical protein